MGREPERNIDVDLTRLKDEDAIQQALATVILNDRTYIVPQGDSNMILVSALYTRNTPRRLRKRLIKAGLRGRDLREAVADYLECYKNWLRLGKPISH